MVLPQLTGWSIQSGLNKPAEDTVLKLLACLHGACSTKLTVLPQNHWLVFTDKQRKYLWLQKRRVQSYSVIKEQNPCQRKERKAGRTTRLRPESWLGASISATK